MKKPKPNLGQFEELTLLAIIKLRDQAYGMKIRQTLEHVTKRSVSIGALYTTLDRLEKKRLITSWQGEATAERGGRAKRYFSVESAGIKALNDSQRVRNEMLQGVDLTWEPAGR